MAVQCELRTRVLMEGVLCAARVFVPAQHSESIDRWEFGSAVEPEGSMGIRPVRAVLSPAPPHGSARWRSGAICERRQARCGPRPFGFAPLMSPNSPEFGASGEGSERWAEGSRALECGMEAGRCFGGHERAAYQPGLKKWALGDVCVMLLEVRRIRGAGSPGRGDIE